MDRLRACKVVGKTMGRTACRVVDKILCGERTTHIPLAQSTVLNSMVGQDTRNLMLGVVLQADTLDPTCHHDMGLLVGSPAAVDGLGFAQEQYHWVHAMSEAGQLAKGGSDGQRAEAGSGRPGMQREQQLAQPIASAGGAGFETLQGFVRPEGQWVVLEVAALMVQPSEP
jgi:hypothetical protein